VIEAMEANEANDVNANDVNANDVNANDVNADKAKRTDEQSECLND